MPKNGKKSEVELYKRRGIHLSPIITNFTFKTKMNKTKMNNITNMTKAINRAVPRPCSSIHSSELDDNPDPEETLSYEETLKRYREFFNSRPLMRCLDTDEDRPSSKTLYDKLLEEVKQGSDNTRGQLQVRAFWDDVRLKLRIDAEDETNEPEQYQESTHQRTSHASNTLLHSKLRES